MGKRSNELVFRVKGEVELVQKCKIVLNRLFFGAQEFCRICMEI